MKYKKIQTNLLLGCVLMMGLLTSSCVELEAIKKFAEYSAAVTEKFPILSNDIYGSCVRRYKYQFYRDVKFDANQMVKIDNLTEEDFENPTSDLPANMTKAERDCRRFKQISPEVIKLNKALALYMKTLGDLAADDLTTYDKEFDDLGKSINNTDVFKESEVKAGISLVKFISNATAGFYRRKKLKKAIESSNADVKVLANALKRYVGNNYVLELANEERQLTNYYRANIKEYQHQVGNSNTLTVISAKTLMDKELETLRERQKGAKAYVKILDKVSEGHQKLYDSRNKLKSKETRQTALEYARAIESMYKEFKEAF